MRRDGPMKGIYSINIYIYMMCRLHLLSGLLAIRTLVGVVSVSKFRERVAVILFGKVLPCPNQKPCVTNPMSIMYVSPLTQIKTRVICVYIYICL